ncbi:MAG: DNA polymerase III subunit delta [Myxococcota bacterium]|nr:DNA polymerase III subunit delta [Myxococcota bacterium]
MSWPRHLRGGDASVYLLHGDESFLLREAFQWLRVRIMADGLEDFNLDRFDARDNIDIERVTQAARTLPMMASKRLVLVRNAEVLFGRSKEALRPLLEYITDPDPTTCLVLMAMSRVKKNGQLYKRVQKHGCVYEAAILKLRELRPWVLNRVKDMSRRMSRDACDFLIEAIGQDLANLDSALERLCLYVPEPEIIELQHAQDAISATRTRTVWELVDAVADRNAARALERAHQLLGQGNAPLQLLALVIRQFRQLLTGCDVLRQGGNLRDAAQHAQVPAFREKQFGQQLKRYAWAELRAALHRLQETDAQLKSSKVPHTLIFEGMILDLCAPRRTMDG